MGVNLFMDKRHDEVVELAGIIQNKMRDESYIFSDVAAIDAADEILNLGYHKTIWSKVADGDLPKPCQNIWFIDERTNLGFSGYYNDIDKIFISDFDNNFCIKKDEVIVWTELPTYKE